jgi:hypothetical protein
LGATVVDRFGYPSGGFRAVTFDALANALKVFCGWHRPTDFHQG